MDSGGMSVWGLCVVLGGVGGVGRGVCVWGGGVHVVGDHKSLL